MPHPEKIPDNVRGRVIEMIVQGYTRDQIHDETGVSTGYVSKVKQQTFPDGLHPATQSNHVVTDAGKGAKSTKKSKETVSPESVERFVKGDESVMVELLNPLPHSQWGIFLKNMYEVRKAREVIMRADRADDGIPVSTLWDILMKMQEHFATNFNTADDPDMARRARVAGEAIHQYVENDHPEVVKKLRIQGVDW